MPNKRRPVRHGGRKKSAGAAASAAAPGQAAGGGSGGTASPVMRMAVEQLAPVGAALRAMMPYGAVNYEVGYKPQRLSAEARRAHADVERALSLFTSAAARGEDFHDLERYRAETAASFGAGDGHMIACLTAALGAMCHPDSQFSILVVPDVFMSQGIARGQQLMGHYLVAFQLPGSGQRVLFDPWAEGGRINAGMPAEQARLASIHLLRDEMIPLATDPDGDAVEVLGPGADNWLIKGAFGAIPRAHRATAIHVEQRHHELPDIARGSTLNMRAGRVEGDGFYYSRFTPGAEWVRRCHDALRATGVTRVVEALPALSVGAAAEPAAARSVAATEGAAVSGAARVAGPAAAMVPAGTTAEELRVAMASALLRSAATDLAASVPEPPLGGGVPAVDSATAESAAPVPLPSGRSPVMDAPVAAPAAGRATAWWDCCCLGALARWCCPDEVHDKTA